MSKIESLVEGKTFEADYSGKELTAAEIAKGRHRRWIGGHFDDGWGERQAQYMIGNGLLPEHKFLDVGCGSFRAGRSFVDYLNAGNYYGVDANRSVMQAGYDVELTDLQKEKLPVSNLRATERFAVDFGVKFDMALAQSVFTHVSLNYIRLCFFRVAQRMNEGGSFFVTINSAPEDRPIDHIHHGKRSKSRYTERDVFWYYVDDIRWAAKFSPWKVEDIGDFGSPSGQHMIKLVRSPGEVDLQSANAERCDSSNPVKATPTVANSLSRNLASTAKRVRRGLADVIEPK